MFMILRRKTLKQAQLSLHKVLHPHSHQKPVLRIILCNAIYEIKVSSPAQWRIQWVNWYVLVCCGYIITAYSFDRTFHNVVFSSQLVTHVGNTLIIVIIIHYIISIIIQCVATSIDSSLLIRYFNAKSPFAFNVILSTCEACGHVIRVAVLLLCPLKALITAVGIYNKYWTVETFSTSFLLTTTRLLCADITL